MYAQMIIIRPPIAQARMPSGRLPPVAVRIFSALKNTPLPMTMPMTSAIAVGRPYFFFSSLSINSFSSFPQIFAANFTLKIAKSTAVRYIVHDSGGNYKERLCRACKIALPDGSGRAMRWI